MPNIGPGTLGGRLSYDIYQSSRTFTNSNSNASNSWTVTGGNDWSLVVFYEMNFEPVIWGADIGVVGHAGTTVSVAGQSTGLQDSQTNFKIETYAAWTVAPDITVLPTIGYGPMGGFVDDVIGASSQSGIYGTVAARFGF